jgi:uncharacterized protein YuzE
MIDHPYLWTEYDPAVDAAYFQITDGLGIDSEEIADGIIVDYDQNDNVIAVELLGVKTINPDDFQKLKPLISKSNFTKIKSFHVHQASPLGLTNE